MDFSLNVWPIALVSLAMIVAAIIDGWKLKVPNALTFPLIISGWILGLLNTFQILTDSGIGGIGGSLTATLLGFALIFPVYAIGGMGAGDVKMQMGFGAWVGAYYSFGQAQYIVLIAFCWGAIIGGIIAFFMILFRRQIATNILNTREILSDLATKSVDETEQKAAARKPRMHLLPYGIPLCLGFLGYLAYLHLYLQIPLPVYPIQ
jgi:prepilin peptidase CpaA